MNVEQWMSRSVKSCTPHDTLEVAARIMWEHDCGVVPIVDLEGRATAMITDRDICMAAYTQGRPLWDISVSGVASQSLFAVRPNDSVQTGLEMMRIHQVRRLPVVDDVGRLVGLVSLNDLARHTGHRLDDLVPDELARTLGAICQPKAPAAAVVQPRAA
jgi:CBS domain-containing protein